MAGDGGGEEVGAVDVDGEELAEAVDGVVGGLEVLGEAGAGDEAVDAAVLGQDLGDAGPDALRVRHIGVVGRHAWESVVAGQSCSCCFSSQQQLMLLPLLAVLVEAVEVGTGGSSGNSALVVELAGWRRTGTGNPLLGVRIVFLELVHDGLGLDLGFLLCEGGHVSLASL